MSRIMTNGNSRRGFLRDSPRPSTMPRNASSLCSTEDDYLSPHSPTDSSEDSVEVKVSPISPFRNKRKCAEPRKLPDTLSGPLKKRVCLQVKAAEAALRKQPPFRPWSSPQTEVLPLVVEKPLELRVPLHPAPEEAEGALEKSAQAFPQLKSKGKEQRNYKNMTRERRIEANARERTRVHTISAAFETLRRAVPAYSHNQKLSKLSVLRIACSYIMTLGTLVGEEQGETSLECVENVSRTIQREGKLRKKKEDGD